MATSTTIRKHLLPRVAVGLSGGVDSSVAALLLLQQGYEVVGVHMQNWDSTDEAGASACPETEDLKDAQEVSKQLGIPFHRADFSRPYWTNVFTPFLEDYERGWTPNPDVLCNREIKFSKFRNFAQEALRTPWVATGHYARLRHPSPPSFPPSLQVAAEAAAAAATAGEAAAPPQLLMGIDPNKDQSYFLSHVPSLAFQHTLFPLGHLTKPQVRALATTAGLCTAQKKESMGICFVGKRRMGDFLPEYLKPLPGLLVSIIDGTVLGEQEGGLTLLTVGQGARIGGEATKWFVCGKDMERGVVWVAPGTDHPALYCDWLLVEEEGFNWIGGRPRELLLPLQERRKESSSCSSSSSSSSSMSALASLRCEYRVRYRQPLASCTVSRPPSAPGMLRVDFDSPQRAVALMQTLALYGGERCLGGGAIVEVGPSYWESGKALPEERVEWAV